MKQTYVWAAVSLVAIALHRLDLWWRKKEKEREDEMVEQLLSSPISFVHKPLALFIH
jgi:hypothetical protein